MRLEVKGRAIAFFSQQVCEEHGALVGIIAIVVMTRHVELSVLLPTFGQ